MSLASILAIFVGLAALMWLRRAAVTSRRAEKHPVRDKTHMVRSSTRITGPIRLVHRAERRERRPDNVEERERARRVRRFRRRALRAWGLSAWPRVRGAEGELGAHARVQIRFPEGTEERVCFDVLLDAPLPERAECELRQRLAAQVCVTHERRRVRVWSGPAAEPEARATHDVLVELSRLAQCAASNAEQALSPYR